MLHFILPYVLEIKVREEYKTVQLNELKNTPVYQEFIDTNIGDILDAARHQEAGDFEDEDYGDNEYGDEANEGDENDGRGGMI